MGGPYIQKAKNICGFSFLAHEKLCNKIAYIAYLLKNYKLYVLLFKIQTEHKQEKLGHANPANNANLLVSTISALIFAENPK